MNLPRNLAMPSGPAIRADIERVAPQVVAAALGLPSSTLHEAGGQIGALPPSLKGTSIIP